MDDLSEIFKGYSQSYPHNLWVRNFLYHNNKLHGYDENFSRYRKQLIDML